MADQLVKQLKEAADAYYNGGTLKMDDETYDRLVEHLRELDPENPFLTEVGAPTQGAVQLPFAMPSLDKIKPGEDSLGRFLSNTGFVISEKLDGLSAAWTGGKLYLRGNGIMGQDISHLAPLKIQGLVKCKESVRGELIIPRTEGIPIGRSWVNGQVHQKTPSKENVSKIHFIAYEVVGNMTRQAQFEWLTKAKFEVPWYICVDKITQKDLEEKLVERREVSQYDTDGLVVGLNRVAVSESTAAKAKNPKDCVAFKMSLADQSAETVVKEVIWAPSAQGYMIPRIHFEPVVIGSASIEYCTGHNARTILQHKLGPGAKIVIRRSGDVIPKLDKVVAATEASFPPEGTWAWDGDAHIKLVGGGAEFVTAKLHYFLKTLEIPGAGPSAAASLVEAGIQTPAALWAATPETLSKILGPKTGANLHANLRSILPKASEAVLMHASSTMPRGVGTTKLTSLFSVEADPRKWAGLSAPDGWTTESFQNFLGEFPKYEAWRKEIDWIPYPVMASATAVAAAIATATPVSLVVCVTGFRDKALEEKAAAKGYSLVSAFSGKVGLLLVPDGELKESEKVKSAKAKGIKILHRSEFTQQYLS